MNECKARNKELRLHIEELQMRVGECGVYQGGVGEWGMYQGGVGECGVYQGG